MTDEGRLFFRYLARISDREIGQTAASLTLVVLLLPASAAAQQADLSRCLAIADVEERVVCYDAIARGENEAAGANPPAPPAAVSVPAASSPPAQPPTPIARPEVSTPAIATREAPTTEFGLSPAEREALRNPGETEPSELVVNVLAVRRLGAGYFRFELSDGTIWELAETRPNFRPPRAGDEIRIRRGALGAFYLDVDRQPVIRIKRIV